ncbi:PREDICTED: uncharacterized protein LOC106118113 [Papilio xuthus]|uniref:Uncharacterized protein LOC106118113 n=1 Tax=Papilio xuthus TaxID=66420 RepID=A0AAJ7E9G7_PAPXU|nr:PREDICTED: uncharacterized protein LOC106118113 [Papilio xuthus]
MLNHLLIMGSAKGQHEKQNIPMADTDKKSIINILKKPFQVLFQKEKKKEKKQEVKEKKQDAKENNPIKVTPVSELLDNFQKLEIKEEDEFANFSYKVIKEEERTPVRADSHSSEDSGYSEKAHDEKEEELIETLKDLKVTKDDDEKKQKKLQTVYIVRAPTKSKVYDSRNSIHPYSKKQETLDSKYRQINQINKQTLSGGHVITKCTLTEYQPDITTVLEQIDKDVQNFQQNSEQDRERDWLVAMEFLAKTEKTSILQGFPEDEITQEFNVMDFYQTKEPEPNPIEEFTTANHAAYEEFNDLELASISDYVDNTRSEKSIFPTPPRSESMTSPVSDSYNTLSPAISSPLYNSDNEKYQDIQDVIEYPKCVTGHDFDRKKDRMSTSSMTMKQYKDLQKDITTEFSKKICCSSNRKTCRQIFLEHMEKLKKEDRKDLCVKVANLDLKTAYGVLHHILLSLSSGDKEEDLQMSLFSLTCERVMAQKSDLFLSDFGLSLIKSSALRCYKRPILTRYLVQCVRTALKYNSPPPGTEYLFHEVDALGDNLLIACVRAGDVCADVLYELVMKEKDELPLFDVHHINTDGYTALHVACSLHSTESSKLNITHVLLQHGEANLWKGDVKGGETAVHLAVNSPTCDLRLVMIIFRQIDRKMWKKLAHSAIKSTTRQNYPHEVLEFLKKCR